jgi:hypothetical protein
MQLGLPSQLRDAVLASADDIAAPESVINKEYVTQQQLVRLDAEGEDVLANETTEKLLKVVRTIATNRSQPKVKMFQVSKPLESADDKKRTREEMEYNEDDSQATAGLALPPGIECIEQLQRLPSAMQSFLKKQYGIVDDSISKSVGNQDKETEEKKPKKQKIKYFPKPPSGPRYPAAVGEIRC